MSHHRRRRRHHGLVPGVPLIVLALAAPARAQVPMGGAAATASPSTPRPLHLEDALRVARSGNWDVLAARSALEIARAQARTAHEFPNPVVGAATSKVHVDGGDATSMGSGLWERAYDSSVQLGQEIEIGGKRSARQLSARSAAGAAAARLADAQRRVEAEVVRAYVDAALAQASARIAGESAGYLRDEARIATVRWQAGDISRSDRDQIEIAASRLELDAENARAESDTKTIALETMIGLTPGADAVTVADSLDALADRAIEAPPAGAALERPDLAAARADLARADGELRQQLAARVPDPTLVVQAEHAPPDRPNTVGVGVSLPLPLWSRNAGAISAARAAREQGERDARRTEQQVVADSLSARASFDEATQRWRRYRDELRPRSSEIRRTVSLAYERGGASLLDLLQAQRSDNDVRLESIQAAGDATIAAAELRSALTPFHPEEAQP